MREIKFRARATTNGPNHKKGDWLFGFYTQMKGPSNTIHFILGGIADTCQPDFLQKYRVDCETLGQFTGEQDRKGIDIYQSDVLLSGMTGAKYLVCWSDENSAWCKQMLGMNTKDKMLYQDSCSHRIIGNIHNNPELIGGE